MTIAGVSIVSALQNEKSLVSDLFHSISQPLTALECGLELSLRRDETAAQFRTRVETALVNAKLLHRRLLEARALQDAGDPGDTSLPIAVKGLLLQLREDLLPVAKSQKVKLEVMCEIAMVRGNDARIRNGFFCLLEFLLRTCPVKHKVSIRARRVSLTDFEVSFRNCNPIRVETPETIQTAESGDLSLRIGQRSFQAAGGDLVVTKNQSGQVAGRVHLLLAN
jgi:hypothetical protein